MRSSVKHSLGLGALAGALLMASPLVYAGCPVTGLSQEIEAETAKLKVGPSWEGQLNAMLGSYYDVGGKVVGSAECPGREYLLLAGKLAMIPKIISAQAVIDDMPPAARNGKLYGAIRSLVMNATEPTDDSPESIEVDHLADQLVKRTGAKSPDELRFASMVVRGGEYADEIAMKIGLSQLKRIKAAPSVITSSQQYAKDIRARVMKMRDDRRAH